VVLCHDSTLERFGYDSVKIETSEWGALKALDMGAWFPGYQGEPQRLLLLSELFQHFGASFLYHIEIKGQGRCIEAAVHSICKNSGFLDRCIFTSFELEALKCLHEINAELKLGWLVREVSSQIVESAASIGAFQLCIPVTIASVELVGRLKEQFPEIRAWGLRGTKEEVQRIVCSLLNAGCDGVTTNWPDWVLEAVQEKKELTCSKSS